MSRDRRGVCTLAATRRGHFVRPRRSSYLATRQWVPGAPSCVGRSTSHNESERSVALTLQQKWGRGTVAVSLAIIAIATLTPLPIARGSEQGASCGTIESMALVADFILNVLLFMPFGLGARLAGWRPRASVAIGAAISSVVELLQLHAIPGRDASALDVVANTTGTAFGILLWIGRRRLLAPSPRAASRLLITSAYAWLLMLIVSGWALQPAPSADPLWGERTPALGGQPSFSGTLQSARLYGVEMPSARLPNERTVREEMHAGRIRLDVVVQPADTLSATGPIVRVADGCGRELLALAQSRTKLVFNMRMHATAIGLTTPSFAMMQALPSPPPDGPAERVSVESIAVSLRRGLLRFTASDAATRSQ